MYNYQQLKAQTRELASDYVHWRMTKAGHNLLRIRDDLHHNSQSKLFIQMRMMAFAFERQYTNEYTPMCDSFTFHDSNFSETFQEVIHNLFLEYSDDYIPVKDGIAIVADEPEILNGPCPPTRQEEDEDINWGRIIAIISFSGCMAVKCSEEGMIPQRTETIIDNLCLFLNNDKRIVDWIELNGNWNGFLEYSHDRVNRIYISEEEVTFSNDNPYLSVSFSSANNELDNSNVSKSSESSSLSNSFTKRSLNMGALIGTIGIITLFAFAYMKKS